jgi:YD repeat-containing protein
VDDPPSRSSTASVVVAPAPLRPIGSVLSFNAGEREACSGVLLATFASADPAATADRFHVRLDWGDGSPPGNGQVSQNADGSFSVRGGSLYAEENNYAVVLTVTDTGFLGELPASSLSVGLTALVVDRAMALQGQPFAAALGLSTGPTVVAVLADPAGQVADDTAVIDWGDGSPASAGQVVAGPAAGEFLVLGEHTYPSIGRFTVRTTVSNRTRTVSAQGQAEVGAHWGLLGRQRSVDPDRGLLVGVGEATADLNTGSLRLLHPLDFDLSPGTAVGRDPALVYNSATVDVRPVIELVVVNPQQEVKPVALRVALQWDDGPWQPWVTFSTQDQLPAEGYLLAVQSRFPVPRSGHYGWRVAVQVDYGGALATLHAAGSGTADVVVRDASPLGAGWGLAGVDRLVPDCAGVLYVTGGGDSRFFGRTGEHTFASLEDFGDLEQNLDGSYTYTAKDGTHLAFSRAGLLMAVVDRHGLVVRYDYSGPDRLDRVDTPDGGETTLVYQGNRVTIYEPHDVLGNVRPVVLTLAGGTMVALQDVDANRSDRHFGYEGERLTRDEWRPLDAHFVYDLVSGLLTRVDRGLGTVYDLTPALRRGLAAQAVRANLAGVASLTDPLQHLTTYTLDVRDRE